MSANRRKYAQSDKVAAIQQAVTMQRTIAEICKDYNCTQYQLYYWIGQSDMAERYAAIRKAAPAPGDPAELPSGLTLPERYSTRRSRSADKLLAIDPALAELVGEYVLRQGLRNSA